MVCHIFTMCVKVLLFICCRHATLAHAGFCNISPAVIPCLIAASVYLSAIPIAAVHWTPTSSVPFFVTSIPAATAAAMAVTSAAVVAAAAAVTSISTTAAAAAGMAVTAVGSISTTAAAAAATAMAAAVAFYLTASMVIFGCCMRCHCRLLFPSRKRLDNLQGIDICWVCQHCRRSLIIDLLLLYPHFLLLLFDFGQRLLLPISTTVRGFHCQI